MQYVNTIGKGIIGTTIVALLCAVSSVSAARLTSPSYQLDTNLGGSFSGTTSSSSYQMESIGGEAVIGNGAGGSYILSQEPVASDAPYLEITLPVEPLNIGQITSGVSESIDFMLGVESTAAEYSLAIEQDHDLQTADASASIPAIASTTALPLPWDEGETVGLGYSVVSAPELDSKWANGANFAAFPGVATTFYTGTSGSNTIDMRIRLDVPLQQAVGDYSHQLIVSGVMTP